MKKIISILLALISVNCIVFAVSGCRLPTIRLFTVGTYETYEVEGEPFTKAKFVLRAISKEEFESSNSINVIKNESKDKSNNIYYGFELFMYDDDQSDFVQLTVSDVTLKHKPGIYDGTAVLNSGDKQITYDFRLFYGSPVSEITFTDVNEDNEQRSFGILCVHNVTGTYETFEKIGNEIFTKVRYSIKPIDKEEYDAANGINVIENYCFDLHNATFCSFELFLLDGSQPLDCQVKISECSFHLTTYSYNGIIEYDLNDRHIRRNFDFYFEEPYPEIRIYANEEFSESLYLKFNLTA